MVPEVALQATQGCMVALLARFALLMHVCTTPDRIVWFDRHVEASAGTPTRSHLILALAGICAVWHSQRSETHQGFLGLFDGALIQLSIGV